MSPTRIRVNNMNETFLKKTIISAIVLIVVSCGNPLRTDSDSTRDHIICPPTSSNDNDYQNNQNTQFVQCPMCSGTGIFDYMPGDIMAPKVKCEACNGTGQCDEATAAQIQQMYNDINAMMNSGGYDYCGGYSSCRNAYEIEYDLQKAYDLLESMQEEYNNCSSGVIRAQYPYMIAEQRSRIAQLEAELRNAQ